MPGLFTQPQPRTQPQPLTQPQQAAAGGSGRLCLGETPGRGKLRPLPKSLEARERVDSLQGAPGHRKEPGEAADDWKRAGPWRKAGLEGDNSGRMEEMEQGVVGTGKVTEELGKGPLQSHKSRLCTYYVPKA
jgi:hypothetical protein